uniref:Lipocalin n=1 Tax=Rhipicephalus appendiculatus TaxID=34631 RepID=A0A131Z5K0_RHIAP
MKTPKLTTELLEGTFMKGNQSLMDVGDRHSQKEFAENLEFASHDYMCGVLSVRYFTGNTSWYDLRFKDPNGTGKPEKSCMDYFGTKEGVGRLIYWETCKTLQ